jgi:type IV pilus assembly protein PilF
MAQMKQSQLAGARASFQEVVKIMPDSELGRAAMGYIDLLR